MKTTHDYVKENWDYLLIIDACRYDVFEEVVKERGLKGKLTLFDTRCGQTPTWYRKYWSYKDSDIHLISSNPQPFMTVCTWDAHKRFKTARWADPESSTEGEFIKKWLKKDEQTWNPDIVLDVFERYHWPGSRYLLHFMPPHLPYLGEKGKSLLKKLGVVNNPHRNIYDAVRDYGRQGHWDEVRECYKENLEYVLDKIYARLDLFPGKVVISSDHAEMLGEPNFDDQGIFGHGREAGPKSPVWEKIRQVPWFEVKR